MLLLVETIRGAFASIPEKASKERWQGERPWSVAVKTALVEIGRQLGYKTAANGCESDDGKEWLYDVVWYLCDRTGCMLDVPLVAESEWGSERAIREDFEKLLVARSHYKIMIFQSGSEEKVRDIFKKMHSWVSNFSRTIPDGKYILIGWAQDRWVFEECP